MPPVQSGDIITFYSYTGGTGRTMALANVASMLPQRCGAGQEVLMIDWSLDSPGLHRYFCESAGAAAAEVARPGLLELFETLAAESANLTPETAFERVRPDDFVIPTDVPGLSLLKSGRFDAEYFTRV